MCEGICVHVYECHVYLCFFFQELPTEDLKHKSLVHRQKTIEKHLLTSKWTLKYIEIRALNPTLVYLATLSHHTFT